MSRLEFSNNLFHGAGINKARSIFKAARVWGAPGSTEANILSEAAWPYRAELPLIALAGMPKMNEILFIHKATKTLIVADLCFNFVRDKAAFNRSLDQLLAHDFENIAMAHGECIVGGGRARLIQALRERGLGPTPT